MTTWLLPLSAPSICLCWTHRKKRGMMLPLRRYHRIYVWPWIFYSSVLQSSRRGLNLFICNIAKESFCMIFFFWLFFFLRWSFLYITRQCCEALNSMCPSLPIRVNVRVRVLWVCSPFGVLLSIECSCSLPSSRGTQWQFSGFCTVCIVWFMETKRKKKRHFNFKEKKKKKTRKRNRDVFACGWPPDAPAAPSSSLLY